MTWELWDISSVSNSTSTLPGAVSGDLDAPDLADAGNGEFELESALPGLDLGYDFDFNGNAIPAEGAHRGAFQYVAP